MPSARPLLPSGISIEIKRHYQHSMFAFTCVMKSKLTIRIITPTKNVHDHQCIYSVIKLNFEYFQAGKQIFHPNISHAECAASPTEWDQYRDKMPLSALHVCFYVFYEKLTFRLTKTFNESFWTAVTSSSYITLLSKTLWHRSHCLSIAGIISVQYHMCK